MYKSEKMEMKNKKTKNIYKNHNKRLRRSKIKMLKFHHQENKHWNSQSQHFKNIIQNNETDNFIKINNYNSTLPKNSFDNNSCTLLRKINLERYKYNSDQIETKYEQTLCEISKELNKKNIKFLLPIKIKCGLNKQMIKKIEIKEKDLNISKHEKQINKVFTNSYLKSQSLASAAITKPIPTVQLLASREERLKLVRYKIGILSSEILEYPEEKSKNFSILLNYMEEKDPEVYVTVRKLATASLLEIFQDFLPSYNLRLIDKTKVKLKKETIRLQNHEASILKYYKKYLQKLEKMADIIRKKQSTFYIKDEDFYLGSFSIICLSNLLIKQQNFNFSSNIANFLVPLLNSKHQNIRQTIANCFIQIFKEDKHGELSLSIIHCLFQYIKKQTHLMYIEVTSVLLNLRIEHINLNKKKQNWSNYKELTLPKKVTLKKIKRKNLKQIKTKIIETKMKQNKQTNLQVSTDIIGLVFKIYFHILKKFRNSQILSSCLEGLSKFSQYINLYFQKDIVNILHTLLVKSNLTLREQLYCVYTNFIILSYESTTFNINLISLFIHFYKILLDIHIAKHNSEMDIVIKILIQVFIYKHKNISQNYLLAFIKRICGMTLNLEHDCAFGIVYIIRQIIHNSKVVSILLDTDFNIGDGIYLSETNDPEYCNAHCTSLWELVALQRHYHVTLKYLSKNILSEVQDGQNTYLPMEIFKLSPEDICKQYDSSKGFFKPTTFMHPQIFIAENTCNNQLIVKLEKLNQNLYCSILFEKCFIDLFKELKRKIILEQ